MDSPPIKRAKDEINKGIKNYTERQGERDFILSRYKNVMLRSDRTVAYGNSFRHNAMDCFRPCCSLIQPPTGVYGGYKGKLPSLENEAIIIRNCFDGLDQLDISAFQLCEKETTETVDRTTDYKQLPLQPLNLSASESKDMMMCPVGHVTHCVLAVDAKSACLEHDDAIDNGLALPLHDLKLSSCLRPLTAFPLHFKCVGSGDPLPYTLVCDHRQDCWDNSDENFCVFSPCAGAMPLKCSSNQQVCVRY